MNRNNIIESNNLIYINGSFITFVRFFLFSTTSSKAANNSPHRSQSIHLLDWLEPRWGRQVWQWWVRLQIKVKWILGYILWTKKMCLCIFSGKNFNLSILSFLQEVWSWEFKKQGNTIFVWWSPKIVTLWSSHILSKGWWFLIVRWWYCVMRAWFNLMKSVIWFLTPSSFSIRTKRFLIIMK